MSSRNWSDIVLTFFLSDHTKSLFLSCFDYKSIYCCLQKYWKNTINCSIIWDKTTATEPRGHKLMPYKYLWNNTVCLKTKLQCMKLLPQFSRIIWALFEKWYECNDWFYGYHWKVLTWGNFWHHFILLGFCGCNFCINGRTKGPMPPVAIFKRRHEIDRFHDGAK